MGTLANDLMQLRKEINADHEDRKALNVQLKKYQIDNKQKVTDMLAGFHSQRKNSNLSESLSEWRADLSEHVSLLKQSTSQLLTQMRNELKTSSQKNQSERIHYVAEISRKVHTTLAISQEERRILSQQLKKDLKQYREKITASIADLKGITPFIHAEVTALKKQNAQYRKEIQKELSEMAKNGQEDRRAYLISLHRSCSQMRKEFNEFRNSLLDDLNGIKKAWHGDMGKESRTIQEDDRYDDVMNMDIILTPPAIIKEKENIEIQLPKEEMASIEEQDDLTLISGIGPERQKQLNGSGIYTFFHLSKQNTDLLLSVLSKPSGKEEVQKWIDQAKELSIIY